MKTKIKFAAALTTLTLATTRDAVSEAQGHRWGLGLGSVWASPPVQ